MPEIIVVNAHGYRCCASKDAIRVGRAVASPIDWNATANTDNMMPTISALRPARCP
ncbi:hypothetical protein G7085_16745 [Tessaracoccus sp. HDW20]|uniref:hypothetical protein n=1 Tax=Tessaracoccus coleopterorum TaxID=2714950 RepID=UPI0018D344AC|nr:hypothetical protein [Tessaracoccus coleopterorum]NHB85691.1 hypothetical protein [Tessaracoccus coleopterorum]